MTLWSINTKAQNAAGPSPSPVAPTAASVLSKSAETDFKDGLAAFQKGDDKGARASFRETLKIEPENLAALFNLGLVESRTDQKGLALALWRKALAVQPDFDPALRAIDWVRPKLDHPDISHEVEVWESFRNVALVGFPLSRFLLVTAASLLMGGWLLLRYAGRLRQARLDEKPAPAFPLAGTLAGVVFVVTALLSVAKAYDASILRGTIVAKKIEARSAPDAQATPLFDLYEGLEVVVRSNADAWTQVAYPGGSTGWIPRDSLMTTNDKAVP